MRLGVLPIILLLMVGCGDAPETPTATSPPTASALTAAPQLTATAAPTAASVFTATATPRPRPTATPVPDSDRDGLLDREELQLGTNPFQPDSDLDGLDDGDEIRLGTDPLTTDTDGDGVVDGSDVSPLADAKVRVSIVDFIDKSPRGLLHGDTNAYFTILLHETDPVTTPVYLDVQHEWIEPVVVDVDDHLPEVRVGILAWEYAPVAGLIRSAIVEYIFTLVTGFPIKLESQEQPYDISAATGSDGDANILVISVPANDTVVLTGDGTDDGMLGPLEAEITVKVEHGHY